MINSNLVQILITSGLVVAIGGILLYIFSALRTTAKRKKDITDKWDSVFNEYDTVLTQAHTKAEGIIEKAAEEATALSTDKAKLTSQLGDGFDSELKKLTTTQIAAFQNESKEFLASYASYLQSLHETYTKQASSSLKELEEATTADFARLRQTLEKEILTSQDSMEAHLRDELSKAKIEIEEYKRHKMDQLKGSLETVVLQISEEVLGHAISLTDHKKLIFDALEQAQKEGVFDL